VQREQFKRLGVIGQWDKPYTTMDYRAEATIAGELHKFAGNGLLYRGYRPVMWSPVEKTALAEAEVEYHEKQSPTIYVKFPVVKGSDELKGASVVIWTTTPWTIPANRAIAFSPTMDYALYEVDSVSEGALAAVGEKLVLLDALADQVAKHSKITLKRVAKIDPKGVVAAHPLRGQGYEFDVPLLPGEHVTADTGTGFVHTAPGHGEEDFELILSNFPDYARTNPEAFNVVGPDGSFTKNAPGFEGKFILDRDGKKDGDANGAVIKALIEAGKLLSKGTLRHSYPHSWRSKAPVIYRATPQWFAHMDKPFEGSNGKTLRELAMQGIRDTKWFPKAGENRIGAMVKDRPDWVLSRQRAWGVPLAIFVEKKTQKVLNDADVNKRIKEAFQTEGADAWFNSPPARFLGNERDPNDYEQVRDILDVWFDSGSTHVFTVEQPLEKEWPKKAKADLYLEGSDQHRGWFQSSLLESCGTRGRAPYKAVLTHGFTMDAKGLKMSKSIGNTVDPLKVMEVNGADIIRLWALSVDYTEDHRIGDEILKGVADQYRKLRNTFRYLLGALDGFSEEERLDDVAAYPELERYMLHLTHELDRQLRRAVNDFDFNSYTRLLTDFANNDLSAFFFDIRKDCLYCDAADDPKRRAYRTTLDILFHALVRWLAPVLVFTTEEVWATRYPDGGSVHLLEWPEIPAIDADDAKWAELRALRTLVTEAIEPLRRDKVLGSSLEAEVTVPSTADAALLAELFISSTVHHGDSLQVAKSSHHKCGRCWRLLPEVEEDGGLCARCAEVVA
jgi:isoleucyl-tRNA synthetase